VKICATVLCSTSDIYLFDRRNDSIQSLFQTPITFTNPLPTASAALSTQIKVLSFLHNTSIFYRVLQELHFKMKFPTSGLILKKYMFSDKTAFHRPVKKMAILEGFQELVAEESPIRNYLLG